MNTERERFQEWLYSQKPSPWQRFNTADEVGFFVWQHQAATIADLQQQNNKLQKEIDLDNATIGHLNELVATLSNAESAADNLIIQLREAVVRYGTHLHGCELDAENNIDCSCGLSYFERG